MMVRAACGKCVLLASGVVLIALLLAACTGSAGPQESPSSVGASDSERLQVVLRSREETTPGGGIWQVVQRRESWDPRATAIVVTDMWDRHWCNSATTRVGELAPAMNAVLAEARRRGVMIVHSPSGTIRFYDGSVQRQRALAAGHRDPPPGIDMNAWCHLDPQKESPLPIDDSDGGCDKPCPGGQPCVEGRAWSRQTADLEIHDEDFISASGQEIYNVFQDHRIENVIVMGVHINMCVLGRPFAIRQMANLGKNVVLMRDMTDSMYNPQMSPHVTHFRGTELVTEHIEKYWAPSMVSSDLTGQPAFRFPEDTRTHIAFVIAEDEYDAHLTLPAFAEKHLMEGGRYAFNVIRSSENEIDGIEQIRDADLVIIFVRRRHPPESQLDWLRQHLQAGKPLIALRTSSHAFETWTGFDAEILGGNYDGHYGNRPPRNPPTRVWIDPQASAHPLLSGLPKEAFEVSSWLYRTKPLANDATPLMYGSVGEAGETQPVTWVRRYGAAKIVYTSLGHQRDFEISAFNQLLLNAIAWATAQ